MAKVIYDYLDRHQNEDSTPKSRNALTGFFFNRCGCFRTGRQFECQSKFTREAGSWDVALGLISLEPQGITSSFLGEQQAPKKPQHPMLYSDLQFQVQQFPLEFR